MLKFFAVLLLAFTGFAQAALPLQTDLPLSYVAQINSDAQDRPLVIFMHGYGSNELDLFGINYALSKDYNYLSVRAPVSLGEDRYQWFTKNPQSADYDGVTVDLKRSGESLNQFIEQATQKYHTQASKVFLIGFSQGAMMTYEVALRHPQQVGGIAALSGKVLPVLKSELKVDPALKNLQVFIGHGNADPRVPYNGATEANSYLKTLGVKPELHSYAGVGHTISQAEVGDLKVWLAKVTKAD
ncbi:alpha/beta hydrolase [Pseudomonas caspiana]